MRPAVLTRRILLKTAATATIGAAVNGLAPVRGRAAPRPTSVEATDGPTRAVDLRIRKQLIDLAGRKTSAMVVNGSLPGPLLRFREGETVTIDRWPYTSPVAVFSSHRPIHRIGQPKYSANCR